MANKGIMANPGYGGLMKGKLRRLVTKFTSEVFEQLVGYLSSQNILLEYFISVYLCFIGLRAL